MTVQKVLVVYCSDTSLFYYKNFFGKETGMYKKVDSGLDFCAREQEVLKFWEENHIFEKSLEKNSDKNIFSFYDGPPTANGKPHIGHILTRVMKDILPRFQTMRGKRVYRKAGWDTHGLPVELEVEKQLGIDGKQEIEKYGIEPFIKKCKESVWKYKGEWERMSDRVGYFVDMEHPYITYDNDYIESVWWSLKEIDQKGLLYKGFKVVPYCPRCGTALSSHEVAQGYKDVKEKSVFVKFEVKGEKNTYLLAWTTTPWTLPSNVALCVNPKEDYVKITSGGVDYILAQALVPSLFTEYTEVWKKKGKEIEGIEYQPLYSFASFREKAYYVVSDDYVTLTDGSGIVHIAPAFGEDDSRVGKKYNLPFVQTVNERGRFVEEATPFRGMFMKDADKHVIADLNTRGLLFRELMYEHSYPHCWRCDTPLIYYARSSWFIKMTEVKDKLIRNNQSVHWMPPSIGSGRMGNFLENVIDWGISRERYWGTPLPVWVCPDCGKYHVIGSREELKRLSGRTEDVELHRPYIDEVTFQCGCGGTMRRTPEVMDCWYDSGSMPFAQYHYPFENKEMFEKNFPADFISEAVDQTRGWFYTLLAISTLIFDKAPFRNCIVLGHVNDKNGIKMSKHKGNVVDPWSVLDKQGADAVRWYFYTASAPYLPSRFYEEAVSEAQRKFMGTLWNAYAFFVLYADIDKYNPAEHSIAKVKLTALDRWIVSELNALIQTVTEELEVYNTYDAARKIQDFTDKLSNWYIRRNRDRFWGGGMTADKKAAFTTLWYVLSEFAKVIAPFTPFMAESIYQNLVTPFFKDAPVSVHLAQYPKADLKKIDRKLMEGMENVMDVVLAGRSARNASGIKNRQPLSVMYVSSERKMEFTDEMLSIVADELNIKKYLKADNLSEYVQYKLKPQLKTLGPKYGKQLGAIRAYLTDCNADEAEKIVKTVKSGKVYNADIAGSRVELSLDDLLIETVNKQGFASESQCGVTVVLDLALTDALLLEGTAREIVSKIQTMRKDFGLEVTDRIDIFFEAEGLSEKVLKEHRKLISDDVLCKNIIEGEGGTYTKTWKINDDNVTLSIRKSV